MRCDVYSKSSICNTSLGLYSLKSVRKTSTSSLTSGSNSYIKQKQRLIANQCNISLDGSMKPIVNNASDGKRAEQYYALLKTPQSISYNSSYVVNQKTIGTSYYNNCAKTSCHMMAKINSKGQYGFTGDITNIGNYERVNSTASDYNPNAKGYFNFRNLNKEELSNIIASEIDCGRSVELHTSYSGGEHWVVVTGYALDSNGIIKFSTENGKDYITGLSGIDPYPNTYGNEQITDNLGKTTTVSTNGQWLNTNEFSYQVFTFNP